LSSNGQEVSEHRRRRPRAFATFGGMPKAPSEALALGFEQALVEARGGQHSQRLVVHRTTPFSVSTTFPVF
jgi:hypothetical protein